MSATAEKSYIIQGSSGQSTVWVRKHDNGEVYTHEQTQEERAAQAIPPAGVYRLKVISFAEPFDMPRAEQYGGGMQTMTRLELEIQEGRGKGKVCTLLLGWSIGPRSNLGKVYRATTGKPVDQGGEYDPTEMLNREFSAYLQPSEKTDDNGKPRGTSCSWDTVKSVSEAAADGDDSGDWN